MTQLTTQSGTDVTRAAFGTMQWGGKADEAAATAMLNACLEAGIIHFDTAHLYTGGQAEEITGRLIGGRDDLFVATKVAYNTPADSFHIRRDFDISRRRLQRDVVDLLYIHKFHDDVPLEDTFETLASLQQAGTVRYLGVSNFAAWQVMKAQTIAATFDTRIDAIQPMMSLVKRQVEVELLPMAQDQDIQVCSYSPLGGGLLTGKYAQGNGDGRLTTDTRYAARYGADGMAETATGLAQIAQRDNIPAATLAVAWLRQHAPQVHPILSARSAEQLVPSLAGLDTKLGPDLLAEITALSATPPPATDRIEEA